MEIITDMGIMGIAGTGKIVAGRITEGLKTIIPGKVTMKEWSITGAGNTKEVHGLK